jgi:TolB-like protein/Flp pilus assembly protein TadD
MHQILSTDILLCEGFRLDRLGLSRLDPRGVTSPVTLGSRALDLAWLLADRHGELISKDEIMETVWPGRVVEENNLTVQISTLRRVFDQARAEGSCIQTVVGHGYRFVAPVTRVAAEALPGTSPYPASEMPLPSDQPSSPVVAPRLSIVVLPFTNLGDDREQQYFADGITEDITTELSRFANMFVISRTTAFTYREKLVDTKQIGRELGVRYMLEGSVRRSGNQLRVNAQLIDAETDAHLWAERFDRHMGDLFALQSEIASYIANALGVELIAVEAARPTERPDPLDYILRGRVASVKPLSRENYAETIGLFEHALALDPQSVEARSYLAAALAGRRINALTDTAADDLARAEDLAGHALAAAPRDPLVHFAKGQVLCAQHRSKEALFEYATALASNRNMVGALHGIGQCKLLAGSIEETIPLMSQAVRLSPRDPQIGDWYFEIGRAYLLQSRTDEAINWFEKARSAQPGVPAAHSHLAAGYALKGETETAAAELAEARRLQGGDLFASIGDLKAYFGEWLRVPKFRDLWEATYLAGLRKAGMPEE